jgi:hypothetical protein
VIPDGSFERDNPWMGGHVRLAHAIRRRVGLDGDDRALREALGSNGAPMAEI